MSITLQEYLANATEKSAEDLQAALKRLPDDKKNWSPKDSARTALDQIAEVAILNEGVADLLAKKAWPENFSMADFQQRKAQLAQDEPAALALLQENTAKAVTAIRAAAPADFDQEINLPWGPMTILRLMSMPQWNMAYHEGQINYIASILGCLS